MLSGDVPKWARNMPVVETKPGLDADIVFSALPTKHAEEVEPEFAQAGHAVFSNAAAHRMEADVPLLIPEVNAEHSALVSVQRAKRGWSGSIVTNCNCTSTGLTVSLKPLLDTFGIQRLFAASLQASSGAGYPGVPSLDLLDNVVPYVRGEEGKIETEPLKMLGQLVGDHIGAPSIKISSHTNRVPVIDGHLVCVSVELEREATPDEVAAAMESFSAPEIVQELPSSPKHVIEVRRESDRPQPRRDRNAGNGMTTVVGRVRDDALFHVKYVVLSHNTVKGAAGGSLQNAELLVAEGLV
jgi:aspartate-semialdehyde dehydrogenase